MTGTASNLDQITAFLQSKGLSTAQVAGVEGNLQVESSFNPTASNSHEGAIGIAQWEGGRRAALDRYAAATGGSETSLKTQLGFLWSELTGSQSTALSQLEQTSTPRAAAAAFDQYYERSSGSTRATREADASSLYTHLTGTGTTAAGTSAGAAITGSGTDSIFGPLGNLLGINSSVKAILNFTFEALFIAGGAGLVVLGLYRASEPARTGTTDKIEKLAPLAAL